MAQSTQPSSSRTFTPVQQPASPAKLLLGALWLAATLIVLAIGFRQAIFIAPTEATMGDVQRIFYWHVPSALLGLIFPYVNFAASIAFLYLRRRNPLSALTADAIAVAAAEVTVIFTTICLATGMLWGKASWGIWWAWDARLTSLLLLWLLYVAYLMTRRLSATGQTGTIGAVISVFAAIDVPIVYFSIQWWRTQHPSPVLTGEGHMAAPMWIAFGWNAVGWLMWGIFILVLRFALERRRQRLDQEHTLRSLEATLTPADGLTYGQEPNHAS
ncbi:cytochrome c biogenesis protein CcsA [Granulicella tundricola]|uniref:Heme exporter protein C n=1 Tax=Granulicella tundricola (strain ATCC BAA-1859 / DSM 23138 / MP5ACTX9) TaxID=1198114 RepID=E8X544_GRATM|nr:cytochrome c biogenesis protein CcsA [Granulicella tundricola]ADW68308.1 cytochrome c assembly protein [Granulicella tundricola MP5ACTX9]